MPYNIEIAKLSELLMVVASKQGRSTRAIAKGLDIKVSSSTVWRAMLNPSIARAKTLVAICKYLGIDSKALYELEW